MAEPPVEERWSDNEKIVAVILLSILVVFSTFFGLILFAENTGGCGARGVVLPCPPSEGLTVMSSKVNSPTNATLEVTNTGYRTMNLMSYYVKNATGGTYANTAWSGPTIQPNGIAYVNILLDGRDFTFQRYNSYTVTIISSKSNQFTFVLQV